MKATQTATVCSSLRVFDIHLANRISAGDGRKQTAKYHLHLQSIGG
jgi:hypothetical protein